MHIAHIPELQTMFIPHTVPFAMFDPVSTQVIVPVAHEVSPAWHGLAGMHDVPVVHATQPPALHTMFVPHAVPLPSAVPVSMHTRVPVAHEVIPAWHGLAGTHATPAAHATQAPPEQT